MKVEALLKDLSVELEENDYMQFKGLKQVRFPKNHVLAQSKHGLQQNHQRTLCV